MSLADFITYTLVIAAIIALGITIWTYAKGLKQSPRDLWFLFVYKIVKYCRLS